MSEKTRLLKLAPEIKVEVKEIVAYLKQEGIKKVSASSFVDADVVQDIRDHFSGKKTEKKKGGPARGNHHGGNRQEPPIRSGAGNPGQDQ